VAIVTVADYVGPELRSAAGGFVTPLLGIGQAIGPALGGFVIEATGLVVGAFYIALLASAIGVFGSLFSKRPSTER
jgi:MFS family permease